jgi:hypothetical protein
VYVAEHNRIWRIIGPDGIDTDLQLASWIEKAIEFVEALPVK